MRSSEDVSELLAVVRSVLPKHMRAACLFCKGLGPEICEGQKSVSGVPWVLKPVEGRGLCQCALGPEVCVNVPWVPRSVEGRGLCRCALAARHLSCRLV